MTAACEIEHLKIILEEEQKQRWTWQEIYRISNSITNRNLFPFRCLAREKVSDLGEKIAEFIAETSAKCDSNRESK